MTIFQDSCSCTSLRGRLLSNMLGDLFSGLQAELDETGTQMPCQLLKCLEDKHNWDRASIVKTNLKNYFSQLLIGELDIAVATSIEKYHAKVRSHIELCYNFNESFVFFYQNFPVFLEAKHKECCLYFSGWVNRALTQQK